MKVIPAEKFLRLVYDDPDWAVKLTEPVTIAGECELRDSPIRKLSPLLRFRGERERIIGGSGRRAATIENCPELETVEGTFNGRLVIEKCEKLRRIHADVLHPEARGLALSVGNSDRMPNIEVIEGTFKGLVDLAGCSVRKLKNFHIPQPDRKGWALSVANCDNLHTMEGKLNGRVEISDCPKLRDIQKLVFLKDYLQNMERPEFPNMALLPKLTEFEPSLLQDTYIYIAPELRWQLTKTLENREMARKTIRQEAVLL